MTAEVAILNKSAIALAADSAVTLGGDQGKIYNTVNKLFTLSKCRPVGIMIYGNAEFMGVPFETIIKVHRESLKESSQKTVKLYAENFLKYLQSPVFSSDYQQESNIQRLWESSFDDIVGDLRNDIREEFIKNGALNSTKTREIVTGVLKRHRDALSGMENAVGFEKKSPSKIVQRYKKQFESARKLIFSSYKLTAANVATLASIAGLVVTKKSLSSICSGIIIAGFGESEMFPHLVQTRIDGVIDGVLKWISWHESNIDHNHGRSIIIPLAQKEMVQRFMEGVDRNYQSFMDAAMEQVLKLCVDGVIDQHVSGGAAQKQAIRKKVEKTVQDSLTKLGTLTSQYRKENFIDPILEIVVNLPKDELANLAEALVNLTSIKRRVSTDRETVGGPIDVAVISKGDGFIWIKRKHYFQPQLNQHFLRNYLIECVGGDSNGKT